MEHGVGCRAVRSHSVSISREFRVSLLPEGTPLPRPFLPHYNNSLAGQTPEPVRLEVEKAGEPEDGVLVSVERQRKAEGCKLDTHKRRRDPLRHT